jgi:predicted MPP superfamily phosphohydrolase
VLSGLEVTDVPLPVRRPGLDGLRIAFLTDLHAGSFFADRELAAIFERVVSEQPDLICFGGDLINSCGTELAIFDAALESLAAPLGVFAVPGNHDHRWHSDMGAWQDFLESRGVRVLANHGVRIEAGGDSFWLAGVDDLSEGRPDLPRALTGRRDDEPVVLLAHEPDHFVEAARHGIDLTLSGHTHGGQIRLFGWAPMKHTRHGWLAGEFRCDRGTSRLYVSRGIGVTILPLRIGARPELPIVRMVAAGDGDNDQRTGS